MEAAIIIRCLLLDRPEGLKRKVENDILGAIEMVGLRFSQPLNLDIIILDHPNLAPK